MGQIEALRVLIVDDHDGMRTLLRTILERAGASGVRDASNGAAALAMLAEAPVDLILIDHMMPEMDGVTFVQRARTAGAEARIIMITGHANPSYTQAAQSAGADAVLVKPVSPRDLVTAIERVFAT
jgi:CheY-like chemotaxis protein